MSTMTELYDLKVGDKIVIGEDNDGDAKTTGDVLVISKDDGDDIPSVEHLDGSCAGGFDLSRSGWKKYKEPLQLPLKRDDKITLELTGEEVFFIKLLSGRSNGPMNWGHRSLYHKVVALIDNDVCFPTIPWVNLVEYEKEIEKALQAAFPPEQVEPEIEELTLEEICEQLGKNIKIVKNKE